MIKERIRKKKGKEKIMKEMWTGKRRQERDRKERRKKWKWKWKKSSKLEKKKDGKRR